MSEPTCRLYLISPPRLEDVAAFASLLAQTLDAGDVACFQLRLKDHTDGEVRRAVATLRPIVQSRDVAFILNDNPKMAQELNCDGVHIGQEDVSYAEARRILGDDAIIGVTCHDSRYLAIEAADHGADYVAFGAFYPSGTKIARSRAPLELLTWWRDVVTVPCVAIGGITVDNAIPLVEAGADFLAVSAGVWDHVDGPAAAVKGFNEIMGRAERIDGLSPVPSRGDAPDPLSS
ncbi:MAG: thiamine phosphate synthase [Alphaproteobacteria bacterium]|nr:thiamine phosphate synthase [Alphaproteobacteria bacterium]